ncbi:twin-arginine translocase subunit TatC, partial [Bacteroidales bacterium OttesenSCG-928-E04]|nr:twin-arginine translocase subunit TatC [Bacteroidales bacterium OttesenSCG-928-E04]
MEKQKESSSFTFWEHLDELRSLIVKVIVAVVLFGVAAFIFKDQLFAIVLAPKEENFITYDLFRFIGEKLSLGEFAMRAFSVPLINTGLAGQFLIHVRVALYAG